MIETVSKKVSAKKVKITDNKPIYPMGGIYGPTVPQVLNTSLIVALIQRGYHVVEILDNGKEVPLNLVNYTTDFNNRKDNKKIEEIKPIEPQPNRKVKSEAGIPKEETNFANFNKNFEKKKDKKNTEENNEIKFDEQK